MTQSMNIPTDVYTDADGSVYVQAAPASETHFIGGCFETGDLPNPRFDVEMVQCLDSSRNFQVVGATRTAPGKVTSTVTGLTEDSSNWLELFADDFCPFFLHFVQHKCGTRGVWGHWERVYTYLVRSITDDVVSALMSREGGNVTTHAFNWTAFPPRVSSRRLGIGRKTTGDTDDALVLWAEPKQCAVACGQARMLGENLYYADDTAGGAVVNVSTDFGETWAASGAIFPVAGYTCQAAVSVQLDNDTVRQICFRDDAGAAPLGSAYSDDSGATWTQVAVMAAGVVDIIDGGSQAAFALDSEHIWVGDDVGEVHFSDDAGLTWTAQGAGPAMSAGAIHSLHFYDANIGIAAGAAGVTAVTIDGGENWAAAGIPAAQVINSIRFTGPSSQHVICANIIGDVYYSRDRGATWTETWAGNGTVIQCLDVASPTVAFLIDDAGASDDIYQTVDGGLTWQQYTTPLNAGLRHITVLSPTLAFACGIAQGGDAVVIKLGQGVS